METPELISKISPFWTDEDFKSLDYRNESFNNSNDVAQWISHGYPGKFTGDMYDMKRAMPRWTNKIVDIFENAKLKNIGLSFYRMSSGTILPKHRDTYNQYVQLFNLQGKENSIYRSIIFLEDWKSGHYFELDNIPFTQWSSGDVVVWNYDVPHMAANIGIEPRYTLQVTGHL